MGQTRSSRATGFASRLKQFLLSAFVAGAFILFALHERRSSQAAGKTNNAPGNPTGAEGVMAPTVPGGNITTIVPKTATYRNGTYTGPAIDVFYGLVQVQVVIQNGLISNVKFLQYPNDRRTSVEINSQVMPWLTQEAIQVQSANVDIITGATLTSEGFATSLQAALQTARN